MLGLSGSELLFYGGIAIMLAAVVLAAICVVAFLMIGRSLKRKLVQEYGEL